ncbi:hypothetical protein AT15_02350 [Kosmotoga arenicorallina S304]|uniref:CYTH domain-containing protein n=1 Tax=Kosmotoga arenicorallina S304 TaxID=1453497 RepID=A0A182C7N5_9BACT|nr:hypothetical protein [Kosmotoga arenicorallina]OAA31688.1 hypothetical protein AT15_02350 [Kosmotoga arenicorallina S304]
MLELERKYLVVSDELEHILCCTKRALLISQWYLSDKEDLRIRVQVNKQGEIMWFSTHKRGIGVVRIEKEREISPDETSMMSKKLKASPVVVKLRWIYPGIDYEAVLDNYYFPEFGYVAEVELKRPDAKMPFPWELWNLPEEVFKDVSENEEYTAWKISRKPDINLIAFVAKKIKSENLPDIQKETFMNLLKGIYY